jgi:hypothetical protein
MTIIIAALGLLITDFGSLIAYFQWRTAHQRVVLELFERRIKVFEEIEHAARDALNAVDAKGLDLAFWNFVKAEANARFLFGEEVIAKLAKRRADVAAIQAFSEVREDHPEWHQMQNRKLQARNNLAAFIQNSSGLFAPYIRLDQKMPSLWWPGEWPGRGKVLPPT